MAKQFPQLFRSRDIRGGSSVWNTPQAGNVLAARFFASKIPAITDSAVKVRGGTGWDYKPVKVWDGSAWTHRPVKFWNGSAWIVSKAPEIMPPVGWVLVQYKKLVENGTSKPSISLTNPVTAGNLLVVVAANYVGNYSGKINSALNGALPLMAFSRNSNFTYQCGLAAKLIGTAGTETVTFDDSSYNTIVLMEFSGNSATPIGQTGDANSKTVTASAANAATGSLVLLASAFAGSSNPVGWSNAAGYSTIATEENGASNLGLFVGWKTDSTAGPSTGTVIATAGSNTTYNTVLATFK